MEEINHADMVTRLAKDGEEILEGLSRGMYSLLHDTTARAVGAGEILDLVKKQVIYGKDLGLSPKYIKEIPENLTGEQMHMLHMAIGVYGEAAELLACVAESVFDGTEFDAENFLEENGDIEFYLEGGRQGAGITREDALAHNVSKLSVRYAGLQYSNDAAIERADKLPETEEEAMETILEEIDEALNEDGTLKVPETTFSQELELQDDRTIVIEESTEETESVVVDEESDYADEDVSQENQNPHSEPDTGEANPSTIN
jgi:hypothetical protein